MIRRIARPAVAALLLLGAGGCAGIPVGLAAAGGGLSIADHVTSIFNSSVSADEKLACIVKAYAQSKHDDDLATKVAPLCAAGK